jgi:hypothetical protein
MCRLKVVQVMDQEIDTHVLESALVDCRLRHRCSMSLVGYIQVVSILVFDDSNRQKLYMMGMVSSIDCVDNCMQGGSMGKDNILGSNLKTGWLAREWLRHAGSLDVELVHSS